MASHLGEIDAREVNSIPIGSDGDGEAIVVRVGRYGPYLQRGEDRASIPEDLPPDELTPERAEELLAAPSGDRALGTDPDSDLPVLVRSGRFGPYIQLGEAVDGGDRPRTASLFKSMTPETVALDQALELLRLPRTVGHRPVVGRGDPGPQRPLRALCEEGHRHPQPRDRGAAAGRDPRGGAGVVRAAQGPARPGAAAAPLRELGAGSRDVRRRWWCARAGSGPT